MLHHREQAGLAGCLYHALYAVLGDETLLAHVDDVSDARWLVRVHAAGHVPMTLFADRLGPGVTPPQFWDQLWAAAQSSASPQTVLVTVESQRPGVWHVVAVTLLPSAEAWISDSAEPALICLDHDTFLGSPYSQAHLVEVLLPADLDAYPPEPAEDALRAQQQARERTQLELYRL
jgi:hypothetical protein